MYDILLSSVDLLEGTLCFIVDVDFLGKGFNLEELGSDSVVNIGKDFDVLVVVM